MSELRVLGIDYQNLYLPSEYASFSDPDSCLDFDVVIWDPKFAAYEYGSGANFQGDPSISESDSPKARADVRRRRAEFTELLSLGRTLVVIVRAPQQFNFDTGERQYSGTGRNQKTTRIVNKMSFMEALPYAVELHAAKGKSLHFTGPPELQELASSQREILTYEAYLDSAIGIPAWTVDRTPKVAGSVLRTDSGGLLLLVPAPVFPSVKTDDDEDDDTPAAGVFYEALLDAITSLRSGGDTQTLPEWSDDFQLPGEESRQAEISAAQKKLEEATAELATAQSTLRALQQRKLLFTGTGRPLELEVRKALEDLGGTVMEPEVGRDDWRVEFPEGKAVVEVKGTKKSGAEKHAAQLEKWVAQYLEETEESAKGILVVNGWKDTPLDERPAEVFPDQMLKYSTAREHCLVSGVQLLGLVIGATTPAKKKAARKLLLSSSGVATCDGDWNSILTKLTKESAG